MHKIENKEQLNKLLGVFDGCKYRTNCYFMGYEFDELISKKKMFFIFKDQNLFLFLKNENLEFLKSYYFIKDNPIYFNLDCKFPIVMEIPFRSINYPIEEIEILKKFGFKEHIRRDLMGYTQDNLYVPLDADKISKFKLNVLRDISFAGEITDLIKNTFDFYTGDLITMEEIINDIKNENIICIFDDNKLSGFLRFYIKNSVSWIGHIVVLPLYLGLGMGKSLVNYYMMLNAEKGIKKFNHWVVSDNFRAVQLYNSFGFKILNKSSISLINNLYG